MSFRTQQEEFWAGEFGSSYIRRNVGSALLAANISFFSKALRAARAVDSCIEFGANVGINLRALQLLYPRQDQYAVEINGDAVRELRTAIPAANVTHGSILDFQTEKTFDLVLIKGVLIHIDPNSLSAVYGILHGAARRYLLICEYYNPTPVSISYRGHSERLFKRDFCGELLDQYGDLQLLDYGFVYRRDPEYPQDDITWFLIEKRA